MIHEALLHQQAWLYLLDLQAFSEVRPSAFVWTQLFSLLIVGLLTAFAFQLLLTNLGLAIAISIWRIQASPNNDFQEKENNTSNIGALAGVGILLTVNSVLFIASYLAVKFTQTSNLALGAVAGIIIWSAYFLILIWISSIAADSLIGSVLSLTIGGFRRIISTIATTLRSDKDESITQEQTIAIVRQEIESSLSPEKLQQLVKEQFSTALPAKTEALAPESHPLSTTAEIWEKIAFYLDNTTAKKLTPKRIDRQLQTILENVRENQILSECDRAILTELVARRQELSDRQKKRIVNQIEETWNDFLSNDSSEAETSQSGSQLLETTQTIYNSAIEPALTTLPKILEQLEINIPDTSGLIPIVLPLALDRVRKAIDPSDLELKQNLDGLVDNASSSLSDFNQSLQEQLTKQIVSIQNSAQERIETLKQQTQQRIETTRQAAATALWWLFAIAFTGAISSALAGMLATYQ
ncbi:MAG: hypothetical protein MUD14_30280 [Hydrococcus sp. Prado102]|jgi:hypothetical protein|nr:hypothetical protein [Hydrococcus sp. Prado102]